MILFSPFSSFVCSFAVSELPIVGSIFWNVQGPAEVSLLNWLEALTIKLLAQLIAHVRVTLPYKKYSNNY